MALIYQYAIELKNIAEERFGLHMQETDNCAGQFLSFDKPLSEEFKAFVTEFLKEKNAVPIFWDDHSISVRDIYNKKHNA